MCRDQGSYTPDFQRLVCSLTLFSFLFLVRPASSDLLGWGKRHSVTREDCSTYGRHSLHRGSSLTFPGRHSSPPRLPQTRISSILRSLLSPHLHLYLLPAHPRFSACSRFTSGEEITSIAVHISATGLHATWASTSFQGRQTGSPHLCLAPVVMMISDMI
jgi:hypothetical protein